MKRSLKKRLKELAAAPGVLDPIRVNAWVEDHVGMPLREPGKMISPAYRRADGKPRLKAQRDD